MDELRNPSFGRALRGYDTNQVDRLIAAAAARLAEIERRNGLLEERLARAEEELETFRAQERAFRDALALAQRTAEQIRARAEGEAEEMIQGAELAKRTLAIEAEAKRQRAEREARQLEALAQEMESGYRAFLVAAHELLERHADGAERRTATPPLREVTSG